MGDAKLAEINPQFSPMNNNIDSKTTGQSAVTTKMISIDHFNFEDTNQLSPAASLTTWNACDGVMLRMTEKGVGSEKPVSVPAMFANTVKQFPHHIALAIKRGNTWVKWTYEQYYNDVFRVAKGFIKLGLEPNHGVGIIGFNSPEWLLSNIGAMFAGGISVGIYATNSPEACQFVAENSSSNIIVVENHMQLEKILAVKSQLPKLKAIVVYSGEVAVRDPNVISWEELLALSDNISDSEVYEQLNLISPNKCGLLIYTSGTTGNPKGVMISHDNLTWTASQAVKSLETIEYGKEVIVSFLPLSHIAAQLFDIYTPILIAASVYFAQPDALKGTLTDTLREVRPTLFLGVPRVWEKIVEGIQSVGKQSGGLKRKIGQWARGIGLRGNYNKMAGSDGQRKPKRNNSKPFGWGLANSLVFKKLKSRLGLDRTKMCISGAAPIRKETLDFLISLNIIVNEIYGMSECSAPHTVSLPTKFKISSCGVELLGVQSKLANEDCDGNGELCMFGRHVFMGYLKAEDQTKEAIDEDGWLHSGDIAKKDKDGFIYITGRLKEMIITAGGENVAPVSVEDAVMEQIPVISHCILVGDQRKFLSMLITLKTEINLETLEPMDQLSQETIEWCRTCGSQANTLSDIVMGKDLAVLKAVQSGIDRANKRAVSRASRIQKWSILPRDFSIPGGELGPTMKIKRSVVHKMYSSTIEDFYNNV